MTVVRNYDRLLFLGAVATAFQILHAALPINILLMLHIPKRYSIHAHIHTNNYRSMWRSGDKITCLASTRQINDDSTDIEKFRTPLSLPSLISSYSTILEKMTTL